MPAFIYKKIYNDHCGQKNIKTHERDEAEKINQKADG